MATGGADTDKLSDETFDLLCTMCKRKGRNREADKYCTDCSDYYCLKCVKVHEDVPSLAGHKILNKGQFGSSSIKPLPLVPTERCDKHGHKPVDMFCQNHDEVGCPTCMAVEHRSCQDIFYIPEFIQKNASTTSSQGLIEKFEDIEKTLAKCIQTVQQEQQKTLKSKAKALDNIHKFRKEINEKLDELEHNSIHEINSEYDSTLKKLEKDTKDLQKTKQAVISALAKFSSVENNKSQAFVDIKKGQYIVNEAENVIDERNTDNRKDYTRFEADKSLLLKMQEIQTLGALVKKCALLQIKDRTSYSVRIRSDKEDVDIITSCVQEDGTIILGDHSNKKLKRLNGSFSVTDHYDLPWSPWQVCAINNQEVAVSYQQPEIMFISLGHKMKQKSIMKTDFYCLGLTYAADKLYITDNVKSVYIYSVSGKKLKQFSSGCQYGPAYSLGASVDGSKIYVGGFNNGLIVLDNDGQVISTFNGREIEGTYDVHCAANGTVLVCGKASKNVLQFDANGKLMGEVLKSKREEKICQTVCCNHNISKMILGREVQNEIEVYSV